MPLTDEPKQPKGAQANAPVTKEGLDLAREYDEERQARLEDQANDNEKLADGVERQGGAIRVGSVGDLGIGTNVADGAKTSFPGINTRFGTTNAGEAIRKAKGLPTTGVVTEDDDSWTAQSAGAFRAANAGQVPGQTYSAEELPDATVVAASNLPTYTIPAGLVVNPADATPLKEDSLNSSQEGGDLATGPKRNRTGPAGGTGGQ